MKKAQLLNPLMNSGHSRWICIWAISSVCKIYFMLAELNEVQDQLRHFVVRSVEFPEMFRIAPCFSWLEAVMPLMLPILGLSGAVPRFSSFSPFLACIVVVAHNTVELQSDREWVEIESVDKDYPQKTILEIHYCNQPYPLRISSQNIVFVPGELSRASRSRYVFAPYQFHNTFPGIPESVRRRSLEHTRSDSKIQCL